LSAPSESAHGFEIERGVDAEHAAAVKRGAGPGLRERKKAKTRIAIQRHALHLFREQGYAATTVDQIAEAAEVSPSTFFRYFPAKEDVVVYDDYDPALLASFRAQPAELTPIQAMRRAVVEVFGAVPEDVVELEGLRGRLLVQVPELRARMLVQIADSIGLLADEIAARTGRDPDDFEVRSFTGAVVGVMMAVVLRAADHPESDHKGYVGIIDAALEHLERGLPL
jgi:AcrR family transcriptional regulator